MGQPLEGTPGSQLVQLMKRAGFNDFDRFAFATITSPPPAIRMKIDNDKLEYDASDIVIAEHLTDHTRNVSLSGGAVNGTVTTGGSLTTLNVTDATMTVKSPLQTGDRVIVASMNGGQTYVVLDRMVTF